MGAILQFCADERIGAEGDFKIGMNEVAIGMPVPRFAVELARDRLSKKHFHAATQQARIYDPDGAVRAGYLDTVVAPEHVEGAAVEHARHLATTLNRAAFALTRTYVREALATRLVAELDEDMRLFNIT
jgi:enoyl-CoA hydratase